MKPSASEKSCESCRSWPSSPGSPSTSDAGEAETDARPREAIRLKMSARNSSNSLVNPMMFTKGERRSWLTI